MPNPSEVILGFREEEKMVVLVNPLADKIGRASCRERVYVLV